MKEEAISWPVQWLDTNTTISVIEVNLILTYTTYLRTTNIVVVVVVVVVAAVGDDIFYAI